MSIYEGLKINAAVKINQEYSSLATARNYWENSYYLPINFIDGVDARGEDILPRHDCEELQAYKKRKTITKPRAYIQQIINQFNSFLFYSDIKREGVPQELLDDADLMGNSLDTFMAEACLIAQIKGCCFIFPDSTAPSEDISVEQARQSSVRPFLRCVDPDALINWSDDMSELVFKFDGFIRYINADFYQDFKIKKNNRNNIMISGVEEPISHGYGIIPIAKIKPRLWKDSQVAKLADITQTIINIQSVLMVELMNKTFTHIIITGDFDIDPNKPIKIGQGRATTLQTSSNGVTPTISTLGGSDTSQSDSLRTSLKDEINELYRTAGLSSPEPLNTMAPESGIAKKVEFSKTESVVKSIAQSCENAENRLWKLLGLNAVSDYPDNFAGSVENNTADIMI